MDILLKADVDSFNLYNARNQDKKFIPFKKRVFERDNNTCNFCDFKSYKHMDVINKDSNYLNNNIDNLVTACAFCAQCHFIPFVGKIENTGGVLIHMPDISQSDLSALCHVSFCLIYNQVGDYKNAEKTYKSLKLRSKILEDEWGSGLSEPAQMGQMIIDTPVERIKSMKHILLKDIRLLPSYDDFSKQIAAWSDDAISQGVSDPV